jgi:hypothetical protein
LKKSNPRLRACNRKNQRLLDWFRTRWDNQMDQDSASGKLDFLFSEAENESAQGLVRPWPPSSELRCNPPFLELVTRAATRRPRTRYQDLPRLVSYRAARLAAHRGRPHHDERFAYFRLTEEQDLEEIADFIAACADRQS